MKKDSLPSEMNTIQLNGLLQIIVRENAPI